MSIFLTSLQKFGHSTAQDGQKCHTQGIRGCMVLRGVAPRIHTLPCHRMQPFSLQEGSTQVFSGRPAHGLSDPAHSRTSPRRVAGEFLSAYRVWGLFWSPRASFRLLTSGGRTLIDYSKHMKTTCTCTPDRPCAGQPPRSRIKGPCAGHQPPGYLTLLPSRLTSFSWKRSQDVLYRSIDCP